MAISYTHHGDKLAAASTGETGQALNEATGARVDVANGAASSALTKDGWYRIAASTSSYVLVSSAATDGTGGEHFPAGHVEVRWINSGDKIGCSAGA